MTPVQNIPARSVSARRPASRPRIAGAGAGTALALILALSGCSGPAGTDPTGTATAHSEKTAAQDLRITKAWVKAAESGMTGAFGEITNSSGTEVRIVGATSDAATELQLHETTEDAGGGMSMKQKEGGFTIPAGGTLTLEPGGNHIMFMGLTEPLLAGQQVRITLALSDGSTVDVDAPVKDFTGANESYEG